MTNQYSYELSLNILKALGGDMTVQYENTDQIWAAIDEIYAVSGDGLDLQALVLNITENGTYNYNITDEVDAYVPVNISVNIPQKYTDEQVEELKETSRQQGYDSGYDKGIADGYVQGESEGYTDGYAEGLEDGAEDQKALLEDITITDNGVYEKEDGYKKVTVEVPIPEIPTFETEELSVELKSNGSYNYTPTTDGYSKVSVTVDVDTSGGGGKPKIYNGFVFDSCNVSNVDFSQYDWSNVTDCQEMFYGCACTDWTNFENNFNGKVVNATNMFSKSQTQYVYHTSLPNLGDKTSECISLQNLCSRQFESSDRRFSPANLANWNTSNVIICDNMFDHMTYCSTFPLFDTSNVRSMKGMFSYCRQVSSIPKYNTSNVRYMDSMFYMCDWLRSAPEFDTSNVKSMLSTFSNSGIQKFEGWDMQSVININTMFNGCSGLKEIGDLNTKLLGTFGAYSSGSWLYNAANVEKIGVIDCDSVYDINYFFSTTSMNKLTQLGGFNNLGKTPALTGTTSNYFIKACPNLTHDSLLNIINKLYDRTTENYPVLTLSLHANGLALLSEDDIAIATNKGWIIA